MAAVSSQPDAQTADNTRPTRLNAGQAAETKDKPATAELARSSSFERAGSFFVNATSFQRAESLPSNVDDLRHAASLPGHYDASAERVLFGFFTAKQTLGLVLGIVLFLTLVIGDFFHNSDAEKASAMLGITALMACFWAFEVIPIYITALLPIVLEPFLQINSTANVASSYFNDVSMLFVGTFLVDIALEEAQLPRRLALNLLLKARIVRPGVLLAAFMFLAWVLSMFTNNIVAALILCPVAVSLMNAAEAEVQEVCNAVEDGGESSAASDDKITALRRFSDCLMLGIAYASSIGGVTMLTATPANGVLSGEALFDGTIYYGNWFLFAFPVSAVNMLCAFGMLTCRYITKSGGVMLSEEMLQAEHESLIAKSGNFSRDELCVGLVLVAMVTALILAPWAITPYVSPGDGIRLVAGASISCLAAVILFLIPSRIRPGEALLTWKVAHEKLDIGVLILLGGGYALASGFSNSGLEIVLGNAFAGVIRSTHPLLLNIIVTFTVALMTQIFGCASTAAAMIPVFTSACLHHDAVVNPLPLVLSATVACSFSFMLPTATPPNVIALAMSNGLLRPLRVRDFITNGLPLTVVAATLGAVLTYYMGQAVFDSHQPLPEAICSQSYCKWLYAPGWVQGNYVQNQACIILPTDALFCQLWNGTQISLSIPNSMGPDLMPTADAPIPVPMP